MDLKSSIFPNLSSFSSEAFNSPNSNLDARVCSNFGSLVKLFASSSVNASPLLNFTCVSVLKESLIIN
jgi:hypothetical protein